MGASPARRDHRNRRTHGPVGARQASGPDVRLRGPSPASPAGVTLTVTGGADGFTAVAGHPRAEQWWCVNTVDGSGRIESVAPDGSC